jgi:TrmH family RNA methyltransferase
MRVVLVRPRDPNNIGAAARALANFGFRDLVVVAPHPPVWREVRSAVGAEEILAATRVVGGVEEAVAECVLVAGTTAGTTAGTRRRIERVVGPAEFFGHARAGGDGVWARTAILFGSEKAGLGRRVLDQCHAVVRIETSSAQPSLNLAQAVAICCYEASRSATDAQTPAGSAPVPPAPVGAVGEFLRAVAAGKALAGAPPHEARGAVERLHRLLARAGATEPELALLRGLLTRAEF